MNFGAFITWVGIVLAVTVAVDHDLAGRGSLYAAFAASLILSENAFVQEG